MNRRESRKQKHAVLKTKSDLENLDSEQTDYVLGQFKILFSFSAISKIQF